MMIYTSCASEVDPRCEVIRRNWLPTERVRRRKLAQDKQRKLIALLLAQAAPSDVSLAATNAA